MFLCGLRCGTSRLGPTRIIIVRYDAGGIRVFDSMYASWAVATAPWILPLALIGILTTPAGVALLMWAGRRRFNRRNFAGVQEFSSYGQSAGHRLAEGLADSFGGLVMAVGLLALFAAGYAWYLQRY